MSLRGAALSVQKGYEATSSLINYTRRDCFAAHPYPQSARNDIVLFII
jgi:hypothetical protein